MPREEAIARRQAGNRERLHRLIRQQRCNDLRRHMRCAERKGGDADDAALSIAHRSIREHEFAHSVTARR
jgi:hypothetical protein